MHLRVLLMTGAACLIPAGLGAEDNTADKAADDDLAPVIYALDPAAANEAMAELQADGGAFDYGAGDGIDAAMISATSGPTPLAAEFAAARQADAEQAESAAAPSPYQQDAIYRMASQAETAPVKAETVSMENGTLPPGYVEVQPGDTVFALSRRYGAKPAEIIDVNQLAAPYALAIGQQIMIPGLAENGMPAATESSPAPDATRIAATPEPADNSQSMETNLAKAAPEPSPAPAPDRTPATGGQGSLMSTASATPQPSAALRQDVSYADETLAATVHTVEPGNTLYSISRTYGLEVTEIAAANDMAAPYTLSVGQELLIPATGASATASLRSDNSPAQASAPETAPARTAEVRPVSPVYEAPTETAEPEERREASYGYAGGETSENSRFAWPLQGQIILGYGIADDGRRNDGINIAAPVGTPIRSVEDGEVVYRGAELEGYGNLLLIKHEDGWVSAYAHTDAILVKKGDSIRKGQIIAKVGTSGSVNQPQLHFELRHELKPTDPVAALTGTNELAARVNYDQN